MGIFGRNANDFEGWLKLLSEFQGIGLFYWQFDPYLQLAFLQHFQICPCLNLGPRPLGSRFQLHNSQPIRILLGF